MPEIITLNSTIALDDHMLPLRFHSFHINSTQLTYNALLHNHRLNKVLYEAVHNKQQLKYHSEANKNHWYNKTIKT